MSEAFIAAFWCPMGCSEVVFAKCVSTKRIVAVCTACGCAWFEPQHETWKLGELGSCVTDQREYAPYGLTLPTREEIRRAGLEAEIVDVQDGERWSEELEWYNNPHRYQQP